MESKENKGITPKMAPAPVRDVKESTPVINVGPGTAEMGKISTQPLIKTSPIKP